MRSILHQAVKSDNDILLEEGLALEDINIEENGETILKHAIVKKNIQLSKSLIKLGINIDYSKREVETGEISITPLMQATHIGSFELCYLLCSKDIDVNFTNSNGLNAVNIALLQKNYPMLFLLLLNGANLETKQVLEENVFDLVFYAKETTDAFVYLASLYPEFHYKILNELLAVDNITNEENRESYLANLHSKLTGLVRYDEKVLKPIERSISEFLCIDDNINEIIGEGAGLSFSPYPNISDPKSAEFQRVAARSTHQQAVITSRAANNSPSR